MRPSMLSSKVVKPGFASSSKVVTPRGNVSVKVWPAPANEDDPQKKTVIGKRRGELARAGFRTVRRMRLPGSFDGACSLREGEGREVSTPA